MSTENFTESPANSLNQFISDINHAFIQMYPLSDRCECSVLEHCEQNPFQFARVLMNLSVDKWNIGSDLINFVFLTARGGTIFCIEGFLGRPHKDRFDSERECGSCQRIKQKLARLNMMPCPRRLSVRDVWTEPREFTLKI